jgi:hypothetical protein
MKFIIVLAAACFVVVTSAVKEEELQRGIGGKGFEERGGERRHEVGKDWERPIEKHGGREKEFEERGGEKRHEVEKESRRPIEKHGEEEKEHTSKTGFKMTEKEKEVLLKEPVKKPHVYVNAMLDYLLSNENRDLERQCFDKFQSGESVDFVIDIAPSPTQDKWDSMGAESPLAYYLALRRESPSQAYFSAIQTFIDAVTYSMKPEFTHSIIVDHGRKFFIRGRPIKEEESVGKTAGDFSDKARNLKTMWPVPTKEVVSALGSAQTPKIEKVIKNNLGRMTKLALWNRDNGLPTVLEASRRSKPVYTFVITDGSSGTRLNDLTEDLSRTTVIDIGNRRFVKTLGWDEMRRLVNVISLNAPQELSVMVDSCLFLICKAYGC